MKYIKVYELFGRSTHELVNKSTLVFSILKTEYDWYFRTLSDDIRYKKWVCLVNERPIEIEIFEKFSKLQYKNYLKMKFLDLDIPDKYYFDIIDMVGVKSINKEYSREMKSIVISFDNFEAEDIAEDIAEILLTIQDYLDNL